MAINRFIKGDKCAQKDAAIFVSAAVNRALAVELYLKALLPNNTRGHKLNVLFSKLEANIQDKIRQITIEEMHSLNITDYDDIKFENDIVSMGKSFENWRYFYSENPGKTKLHFFKAIRIGIKKTIELAKSGQI